MDINYVQSFLKNVKTTNTQRHFSMFPQFCDKPLHFLNFPLLNTSEEWKYGFSVLKETPPLMETPPMLLLSNCLTIVTNPIT